MTTLRDLVLRVEEADVTEVIGRLYDRRETPWLPEAVTDVLAELRRLTPDASGAEYQLDIELLAPIDPDDEPYWTCLAEKKVIRSDTVWTYHDGKNGSPFVCRNRCSSK